MSAHRAMSLACLVGLGALFGPTPAHAEECGPIESLDVYVWRGADRLRLLREDPEAWQFSRNWPYEVMESGSRLVVPEWDHTRFEFVVEGGCPEDLVQQIGPRFCTAIGPWYGVVWQEGRQLSPVEHPDEQVKSVHCSQNLFGWELGPDTYEGRFGFTVTQKDGSRGADWWVDLRVEDVEPRYHLATNPPRWWDPPHVLPVDVPHRVAVQQEGFFPSDRAIHDVDVAFMDLHEHVDVQDWGSNSFTFVLRAGREDVGHWSGVVRLTDDEGNVQDIPVEYEVVDPDAGCAAGGSSGPCVTNEGPTALVVIGLLPWWLRRRRGA